MNWRVVVVGKPSFPWVRQGVDTYLQRMQRFAPVELRTVKRGEVADFQRAVGAGPVICLDERGALPSTLEVVEQVRDWELERKREISVCIGGSDGLPSAWVRRADAVWSLGRMTLMHELALLVWMEQLYRVYTVLQNHPYHREG